MVKLKCACLVFCSPCHFIILFGFKCFILYIVHQIGPPPSFNFQVDLMHLRPTFKLNGKHIFHCSHGGMNYIPWCCSRCLHLHHEKCGVSCITWTNSCPSITFPSVFLPVGWYHIINWWHLHHRECCHYSSHLSKFGFTNNFISWGGHNGGNPNKRRILP